MKTTNFVPFVAVSFLATLTASLASVPLAHAQMVSGSSITHFAETFGLEKGAEKGAEKRGAVTAQLIETSVPGSILHPDDSGQWTFQLTNAGDTAQTITGRVEVIAYGTKGEPGDIWKPTVFRTLPDPVASVPFTAQITPGGFTNVTVSPVLPARFGAYALIVDLGTTLGRRFLASCVRTFKPTPGATPQYPSFCLDDLPPDVLSRLDTHAIRFGISYKRTTDPDFPRWYADLGKQLMTYKAAGVTVLSMMGGGDFGGDTQPLGRPRPWLDTTGKMQDTKFDLAWKPQYDPDFQELCYRLARDYGYPKGPINAFSLWNEPWEGISISGWGADMIRYREIFTAMCQGVDKARKNDGVDVLLGGGDSTSNALDKFFSDGSDTFLPWFDYVSIHYQGLDSGANIKPWHERKNPRGRTRIWDTESWVANTDDRVAAVVAGDRAAGYDRAMGVYGGNICDAGEVTIRTAIGAKQVPVIQAWSVAASVGASQHFIGERKYNRLLFQNGLPWVMLFDGLDNNPDDGTVVVVGDIGEEFGANNTLHRTARGFAERRHKAELQKEMAALPASASDTVRADLQTRLETPETLSLATLVLPASPAYALYDFYGNLVPAQSGQITVPLDGRGFFLRPNGTPGSFVALTAAIQNARITGIEPLETQVHDFTAPLTTRPPLRVTFTNVLNRRVTGAVSGTLAGVSFTVAAPLSFAPGETRTVSLPLPTITPLANNTYPLALHIDAGADGVMDRPEDLHANVITRRTIRVDGDLADWKGIPPQTILPPASQAPGLTEAAWFSFKELPKSVGQDFATGYLAYDDNNFYFAARVADSTPDEGMVRMETRNDDDYFYPAVSYDTAQTGQTFSVRWSGYVGVPKTGTYTFTTVSDDGVRLFVNDKSIIDNWTNHAATENSGTATLEAGKRYSLRMEYFQSAGGATARLFSQSETGGRALIATQSLWTSATGDTHGLTGTYYGGTELAGDQAATRIDKTIDFDWAEKTVPVPELDRHGKPEPLTWPTGIRRYSYRKDPELPSGNAPGHDNIQIAFNVLPLEQKPFLPAVPGSPPGLVGYHDSDYEFALNPIAPQYGGGVEVWRLAAPGLPSKHFYPRQPRSPKDSPVRGAKLVIRRDAATRYVECAIPWSEMPEVKARIEAGQTVKFSFRVNDNKNAATMELSRGRSVAKRNGSFHVDWLEHWGNALEFGAVPAPALTARK